MSNTKPIEIFTALDLEMNQPSKKIIQIGACVGNIKTGQIFKKLSIFVNPNEHINPFITELTKITQEDVDNGYTLEEAYRKLQKMHENYGAFVNCATWGGGDSQELLQQLQQENPHFEGWCFGRRWIDTKTLFVSWRFSQGQPIQGGLAKSMTKVGLRFEGQKHNAMDDAVNTFKMYCKMLSLFKEAVK
jgi:inhibitor of KinA sporulation pathway (predicted exonuclease)